MDTADAASGREAPRATVQGAPPAAEPDHPDHPDHPGAARRAPGPDALTAPEPGRTAPTDAAVSARYAALPRSATTPETALRRALHAAGLRFRVQYVVPGLPRRKVDIAFTRWRLAVQVDGCFWHGCPDHGTSPTRNSEWWRWKIERNQARDADTNTRLAELGWQVLRVWEHEDTAQACQRVITALRERQATLGDRQATLGGHQSPTRAHQSSRDQHDQEDCDPAGNRLPRDQPTLPRHQPTHAGQVP